MGVNGAQYVYTLKIGHLVGQRSLGLLRTFLQSEGQLPCKEGGGPVSL